ncbi:MAG: hypothetical protein GXP09_08305 [Gammaproteobacteria bacterium]|nr:hypothetical protein [Gammaproteobacteria bacterium]
MRNHKKEMASLKFEGDCTIYEVTEHYKRIMEAITDTSNIKLDLMEVETIDSSFIQLLIYTQIEANRNETLIDISANKKVTDFMAMLTHCKHC